MWASPSTPAGTIRHPDRVNGYVPRRKKFRSPGQQPRAFVNRQHIGSRRNCGVLDQELCAFAKEWKPVLFLPAVGEQKHG